MEAVLDIEGETQAKDVFNGKPFLKITNQPVALKFIDVVYTIKVQNGMVRPGEMLSMLGPSGSGKTTLLTALGGRLGGHLKGSITYKGNPFGNLMKRKTGFVTQDDVLYPHLTVTETLVFTALLRLPNSLTKQDKIMHAEAVIDQLGLVKCKHSIVGKPLYFGQGSASMDYFSSIGYAPSVAMNPFGFPSGSCKWYADSLYIKGNRDRGRKPEKAEFGKRNFRSSNLFLMI
ncbi:putative Beta-glucosidase 45 [Hibiscus syriacus]|uniref:Beta-glucosidase 45 n=1 Tax=Hibiscus syriacus TaxID=106335 RepID=A0A6A3C3P3_HIBSY|nr:putative Beta-glucosidase 45 [Hibiscus syriacus]